MKRPVNWLTAALEAETRQVMKNIGALLQKEGLAFMDLVSVTIYLKSMDHYQLTNENIHFLFYRYFTYQGLYSQLMTFQPKLILKFPLSGKIVKKHRK
jgi:enamine deaminase RidA (YjgF/YER057c/UK114 family)